LDAATTQTRRLMARGACDEAWTTQAGAGLIAIELQSGKIALQSPSFEDLTSWTPVEARGSIRASLDSRDGDDFHSFCLSVVRDAGEPNGETFRDRDKVVGRSITVRFFTRAPGPPGLRNPEWLLMVRTIKLTLVGVQPRQLAGESPAAGMKQPFFGQARIPEAIGVFTADLSGKMSSQWTVHAAHIRNLLDMEVAPGTYEMDTSNQKPLEQVARLFNFEFSKKEGGGASLFSRAAAQLEKAATSAFNMAQRYASWLTSKAMRGQTQWSMRLDEDDAVSISFISFFLLKIGGFSTSILMKFVGGKVGLSHGGLDFFYFVADPEQPLDSYLRAAWFRIASTKIGGGWDGHHPLVVSCAWVGGNFQIFCKSLALDTVGKKIPREDVELKVSPGGEHVSDGTVTICVGGYDVLAAGL